MRGLPRKRLAAGILLAFVLTAGLPAVAQDLGKPVARVTKISEDGRLSFSRADGQWYQAYIDMKDYVNDQLKTDGNTFGSIEFYTGGQIGINKNSAVKITSQSEVNTITVQQGGIWGKMAKQEKPLEIRTSSGVMGIKGTEFVVTETEQGTEVSVLEGQVEVTPADGGEPTQVMPGTQVLLKLKAVDVVKQGEPEDLREEILDSQEWKDFNEALSWARYITSYIPGASLGASGYYAGLAVDLVQNPAETAQNYAISQVNAHIPGPFGIPRPAPKPKEPDFPSQLVPDYQASAGAPIASNQLNFSWKGIDGAEKYVILVSRDEEMNDLAWSGRTSGNTLAYPADAQPLAEGRYYWRVIGLDGDDEPVGKAAQTWFDAAAPPATATDGATP